MKTSSIIAFLVVSFLSLFVNAMDREEMSMKSIKVKKGMDVKKEMKRRQIRRQLRRDIISAIEK
jgi:hypothetical protein